MKAKQFYRATSLDDAYQELLKDSKNTIVAGGQWIKKIGGSHNTLIDISGLNLDFISEDKDYIQIGAMTSERVIETSPLIKNLADGILSDAISQILGVPFRNLATIGGSIVGKYPFSDIITPLLALDCHLIFYPERKVSLKDYLADNNRQKEILVSIFIKKENLKGYFKKVKVTALDFPLLNVAITKGEEYRIVCGGRPLTGALAVKAMEFLNNIDSPSDSDFKKAAEIAVSELSFNSTMTASKEYRELLANTYIYRGLKEVSK